MLDTTATNLSKVIYIFGFIIFQGPNGDPGVCPPSPVLHQLVFLFFPIMYSIGNLKY